MADPLCFLNLDSRGFKGEALFRACDFGNPAMPEEVRIQTLC